MGKNLDEIVKEKRAEYRKTRRKSDYAAMWKAVRERNAEVKANAPKHVLDPSIKPITLKVQDGKHAGSSTF